MNAPEEYTKTTPESSAPKRKKRKWFPFRSAYDLATYFFDRKVRLELDANGEIILGPRSKWLRKWDQHLIGLVGPSLKLYLAQGATAEPELICDAYEASHKAWRDGGEIGPAPGFPGFAAKWVPMQPVHLLSKKGIQRREAVLTAMAILRTPPAVVPEPPPVVPAPPPPVATARPVSRAAPVMKSVPTTPVTETRHASGVFFRVRGRP